MGYSSESDMEVEIGHDNLRNSHEDDDEIMMALGFPLLGILDSAFVHVLSFVLLILLMNNPGPPDGPIFNHFHLT